MIYTRKYVSPLGDLFLAEREGSLVGLWMIHGVGKMSAQAVGGAVSHNPISIIIPCHRVIGANGKLTGYAGGIDKKIWLLTHEGRLDNDKSTIL